jgi:oxygen-independent coproporphyrinogen-3 oxidase
MFDLQIRAENPFIKFDRQLPMFNWHYPFDSAKEWVADREMPFRSGASLKARRRAIYVHIPFCDTICTFCLFRKDKYQSAADIERYVDALIAEFDLKRSLLGRCKVDAIFVGGGTPSMLNPEQIDLLGNALQRNFDLKDLTEFTFEVEAKSVTPDKLSVMRSIGVNRVSFGAQTFSTKYRALFSLDATLEQIETTAQLVNGMFPYTNVDILYGLAGQNEDELLHDAESAMRLRTTTVDFYPINNLTAPRMMHKELKKSGLVYLPASTRLQYRMHLDDLLRSHGYAPINGYSYSKANETDGAVVQHAPKFLYHDLVYGYHNDEVIGYGSSAISQMMGFNLHNNPDRRKYVVQILEDRTLPHEAFGPLACPERGVVLFPFRGVLEKARISWDRLPLDTWIAFQKAIEAELVIERDDRYELSRLGWLFYVNLMYCLMPERGKNLVTTNMEKLQDAGRSCGETDLSRWTDHGGNRIVQTWLSRSTRSPALAIS